ncbi:MAG: hypothetical protein A2Z25_08345 [Planctomycetes bacterium RBG_16_55_9]|nr:MAG: hypothetical protein A2Z25_08345 [Planctomycetes bacterium RBG_16_55_9]
MSRELEVLKKGKWFLRTEQASNGDREQSGRNYTIDYRYAICYSLLNYLNECGHNKDAGKEVLKDLSESVSKSEPNKQPDNFIELIPLAEKKGLVAVDKARGMFPLVLYSDSKNRNLAYEYAVKDVSDNYDNIYPLLEGYSVEDWDEEFQAKFSDVPFCYKENVEIPITMNRL